MEQFGYYNAEKQFIEKHGNTKEMYSFSEVQYLYLLDCIKWFVVKNSDIVDNDNEKDIMIRSFTFGNLEFCKRIKNAFDLKIEYSQKDNKFYLIKIVECDYKSLFEIMLRYVTGEFYVL